MGSLISATSAATRLPLSVVPHHFVIDRCYIHGDTNATIMKYGVALNCANAAIIDSYISDFHSVGYDAQAISGTNGTGPFKIINNYLEASGENIMFGGATPGILTNVPADIVIRKNYMYKPHTWMVGDSLYAGKHWTIKNLFELKTGYVFYLTEIFSKLMGRPAYRSKRLCNPAYRRPERRLCQCQCGRCDYQQQHHPSLRGRHHSGWSRRRQEHAQQPHPQGQDLQQFI